MSADEASGAGAGDRPPVGLRFIEPSSDGAYYVQERALRQSVLLAPYGIPAYYDYDARSLHLVALVPRSWLAQRSLSAAVAAAAAAAGHHHNNANDNNNGNNADSNNDIVVGCVMFCGDADGGTTGRLLQMVVDPVLQRAGIGHELVLRLEEELLRQRRWREVYIHAREDVVAFYAQLGYRVDGEVFVECGLRHRMMRRVLEPIGTVLFDCGGVLTPDTSFAALRAAVAPAAWPTVEATIRRQWQRFRVDRDMPEALFWHGTPRPCAQPCRWPHHQHAGRRGVDVLVAGGLDPSAWSQFNEHLLATISSAYWSVLAVAERLKHRGLRIGILSNYNRSWFEYIAHRFSLRSLFDHPRLVLVSYEVGCAKPDAAIFRTCLARCDCAASRIVLVDNQMANVRAARRAGLHAIHFAARPGGDGIVQLLADLEAMGLDDVRER